MNESEQQVLEKIKKECLTYFHQNPVWEKILKGFRDKYSSYGRFGGKVVLKNLKSRDIEELEGFFGKSFHGQKSVTVSAEKFQQALKESRYKDIPPKCLLDDISNYAMLYQVEAVKKDGSFHKGMEGFASEQHIVQVPLAVITEWESLYCPQDEIYIVENPSVFAVLCGKEKAGNVRRAYMCMNGQPRLAGLMVLDLFAKSGIRIYYAGDLDPEGLLIAQKLSQYCKGEFHYWHMETADYEKCRSEKVISPKRMKILERITDERLNPVLEKIEEYRTAGYQEMLVEEMKGEARK